MDRVSDEWPLFAPRARIGNTIKIRDMKIKLSIRSLHFWAQRSISLPRSSTGGGGKQTSHPLHKNLKVIRIVQKYTCINSNPRPSFGNTALPSPNTSCLPDARAYTRVLHSLCRARRCRHQNRGMCAISAGNIIFPAHINRRSGRNRQAVFIAKEHARSLGTRI